MITLADVLEALTQSRPAMPTFTAFAITEAAIDSQQVKAGTLFVAIRGEKTDSHNDVEQAFQRGAIAALIERPLDQPFAILDLRNGLPAEGLALSTVEGMSPVSAPVCLLVNNTVAALQQIASFWRTRLKLRVIGITGSVGKSTSKEAIAGVLGQRFNTLKSTAILNNEIGLPLDVFKLTEEHQYAVLEMGSYLPGEIAQLCSIARPQVGVLTNIGTIHAERAGSREAIALGKGELVEALPDRPEGIAILRYDDPLIRPMKSRTNAKVFYYGMSPAADLWAGGIESLGLDGIRFRLSYKNETVPVQIPMIGRHSAETALCAAAVGLVEGLSWDEIIRGLQENTAPLRLVAAHAENGALILDDTYNASPESALAALDLLHDLPGRRIAVLGDMHELGPYERAGHETVGARAAQVADILLTLGPRAHIIAEAAAQAGMQNTAIREYEEIGPVADWLKKNLNAGDVALIQGSHGLRVDEIITTLELTQ